MPSADSVFRLLIYCGIALFIPLIVYAFAGFADPYLVFKVFVPYFLILLVVFHAFIIHQASMYDVPKVAYTIGGMCGCADVSFGCSLGKLLSSVQVQSPFSKMSMTADRLLFFTPFGSYELDKSQVKGVYWCREGFSPQWGLWVAHNKREYPRSIIFYPTFAGLFSRPDKIKWKLQELGYPFAD